MVALTLPDGARREFPNSVTGTEIAESISKSLAKKAVAMALDGRLTDLADPVEHDAGIEIVTRECQQNCKPTHFDRSLNTIARLDRLTSWANQSLRNQPQTSFSHSNR